MTLLAIIIARLTYFKQYINNAYFPKKILLAPLFSKTYFNICFAHFIFEAVALIP